MTYIYHYQAFYHFNQLFLWTSPTVAIKWCKPSKAATNFSHFHRQISSHCMIIPGEMEIAPTIDRGRPFICTFLWSLFHRMVRFSIHLFLQKYQHQSILSLNNMVSRLPSYFYLEMESGFPNCTLFLKFRPLSTSQMSYPFITPIGMDLYLTSDHTSQLFIGFAYLCLHSTLYTWHG